MSATSAQGEVPRLKTPRGELKLYRDFTATTGANMSQEIGYLYLKKKRGCAGTFLGLDQVEIHTPIYPRTCWVWVLGLCI